MRAEWRDQLARLAVDLAVDQDVGADLVVVPMIARRVLEIPVHLAGCRGPTRSRCWCRGCRPDGRSASNIGTGLPVPQISWLVADVVGAGDPHGAAAGLPGVVLVLPGLAAGFAGRRNHVFAPHQLAGRGVERGDPVAHAAVAAGGADDDLVLDGERRRGELQVGLVVAVGLPDDLAGLLVGRDDARPESSR